MIVDGLWLMLQITAFAAIIGIFLGLMAALMRISRFKVLRGIALTYITVIRGTPMLVQLMIWWFVVFSPLNWPIFLATVIAFGVNSGAYVCEIFRGGIMAVDHGQTEAGRSLGLTSGQNMRLIVLPQATKNSLPTLVNEFITLIKETSLAAFIGVQELTFVANHIRSRTFSGFVPLFAVALVYLSAVMLLTWLMGMVERRLRKSDSR
ncbi:MAG: amino acid ABC transporter permease [Defluviitaleaceae bacterium]|nr:amino acid ABC transporter permease [Defluviitaleaceae bacterium]